MNPYEKILGVLNTNSVKYQVLDHEPVYTSEDAARVRGLSMESGAKSLLLKTKDNFILVVISGSKKIDSKKLKMLLGVKEVRFATPDEVEVKMGCKVGACYPLGSIASLKTYLDSSLLSQPKISFNPGVHNKSIKLKLNDYITLEDPEIIDTSA